MTPRRRVRATLAHLPFAQPAVERYRRMAHRTAVARELERNGVLNGLSHDIQQWAPFVRFAPPGHFYSPLPRLDELHADSERIFDVTREVPGIELDVARQLDVVEKLGAVIAGDHITNEPTPERRYYADNPAFGIGDATMLHGVLRRYEPARIVEIGSGYSSALVLDVVEHHLPQTDVTFVEPYTELLRSLMRPGDDARCRIIEQRAQDVPLEPIQMLGENDVLFIDSTHVVRTGSDVCHLVLEVLPRVAPGVLVHVHDIFWPFELPRDWVEDGRQWGECYLVRAFLTGNPDWEILLFNDYLGRFEGATVSRFLPQFLGNPGGSLWLRRVS